MPNPFKTDAASNIENTVSVCVLHTNPPMLIDLSQTKNTRFMTMSADDFTSLLVVLHYNYSCIILVRSLEKKKSYSVFCNLNSLISTIKHKVIHTLSIIDISSLNILLSYI